MNVFSDIDRAYLTRIVRKEKMHHMKIINANNKQVNLTLTMPSFLNGIIHLPFMELSIIIFRDIKMKI